jgi:SSS family solute:Na+ symporter
MHDVAATTPIRRRIRAAGRAFLLLLALLGAIAGPRPLPAAEEPAPVDARLRRQCVAILQAVLRREVPPGAERWMKVHAAEYLLALDYPQGVRREFQAELEAQGREPRYRIGIWRVLSRGTADAKVSSEWSEKIRDVFVDPTAPDRTHALESLAKLRYKPSRADLKLFQAMAREPAGAEPAFAAWVWANVDCSKGQARLAELLESSDAKTRGLAAYALRHLPRPAAAVYETLVKVARSEPAGSPARLHLVCAAALLAPEGQRNSWRAELLELLRSGSPLERYQACDVLGDVAGPEDLPILTGLLTHSDDDVRCGAASAILRIGRRVPHYLGWIDWAVMALYATGMVSIGWYYSRRSGTREEYLLGGRQMRPLTVGLSMFASLISTISYLAWPGEVVQNGPMMMSLVLAYPFVGLVVGWLIIPYIMKLRVTSAYEILETRLGLGVRMLGSLLFLTLRLFWMGMIIYAATTRVVVPLFGLPPYATPIVCAVLGLVTVMYTSMGGLKAVVLTDVIQTVILFGSAILALVFVTYYLGGVSHWWPERWPEQWPAPKLYDPSARVSLLTAVIAAFVWHVCTSGSDQIAIQRYLSTKDAKSARIVIFTTLTADTVVGVILGLVGLGLWGYFRANPHLVPDGQTILTGADHLLPRFIVVGFPAGFSGLVVAGLVACAMSCLAAGVNSSCSVITVDFIDRFRGKNRPADAGRVRLAKVVSVLVGVTVVLLSFLFQFLPGNLLELSYKVVNLLTAPIFGLFFMALWVPWATGFGTIVGTACGVATAVLIAFWDQLVGTPGISFLWALPASFVVEVGVACLASLLPVGRRPPALEEVV